MPKGLNFRVFSLGLLGLVGLLIVGAVFLIGNSMQTKLINVAQRANGYVVKAQQLDIDILNARRAEKDFLLRADKTFLDHHAEIGKSVLASLKEIGQAAAGAKLDSIAQQAQSLTSAFELYQSSFDKMAEARIALGLTPDKGLEGSLRNSVHAIEAKLNTFNDPALTAAMLMLRRHEKDFMLRRDDKYVGELKSAAQDFSKVLAQSALPDEAKKEIGNLLAAYMRDFLAWSDQARDVEKLTVKLSQSYEAMDAQVTKIVDSINEVATAATRSQVSISHETSLGITASIAAVAVLVMLLAWLVGRSIVRPLSAMTEAMSALAGGNLDTEITGAERRDEIGSMARALDVFKAGAIENRRLEQEAEGNRQRAEAERIAMEERAQADAAERLRVATAGLAAGLKRLASGDLSFQLTEAFAPDFEALRADFNQSVHQLGDTMRAISEAVGVMDMGTREIAAGADDLSRRTEQQAASLEETAAAVEEITSNVASSTLRTDEARSVANRANESAKKSADVVSDTEAAMREIEASSRQISNIIGVIDEIAFQTNLLALNAGVEAARAGEAGKGFAVVAQEVRELAQRAAAAAKEIKSLIGNSSSQVENGVRLVRDTSEALGTIGNFIAEMNGHMEAIATSAREQSTGLKEVNQAVNAMDQTTQQNAAMVEESNAASSSLAQEAAKLRELLSQFQLGQEAANQAAALRQTARAMAAPQQQPSVRGSARTAQPRMVAAAGGAGWEEF